MTSKESKEMAAATRALRAATGALRAATHAVNAVKEDLKASFGPEFSALEAVAREQGADELTFAQIFADITQDILKEVKSGVYHGNVKKETILRVVFKLKALGASEVCRH